jgi:EAL domain-containing protein (putative c-di-GMP-specific phosphodiesterase class I)
MLNRKMARTALLGAGVTAAIALGTTSIANAQSRELWLQSGGADMVQGYFYSGEQIYGWCDQDCYDLDLFIYDSNGHLVMQDVAVDANPVVSAPYDGTFYVEVTMPNCAHPSGCAVWLDSDAGF